MTRMKEENLVDVCLAYDPVNNDLDTHELLLHNIAFILEQMVPDDAPLSLEEINKIANYVEDILDCIDDRKHDGDHQADAP